MGRLDGAWRFRPGNDRQHASGALRRTYPTHIVGRLGWHTIDTSCPIGPGTWAAACAATDVATTAAQLVMDGEDATYALCRPPGHHAYRDLASGFCFLNNSAVAAAQLKLKHERVAILDVDVHHGNGTQGIFYERPDVLTVSIHADPSSSIPFVWGYAHERGAGPGLGANLNIPLPKGTGDDDYIKAIGEAQKTIRAFAPGALVVALGLDASEHDPLAGLAVTTAGFRFISAAIAGLPTVFVQEEVICPISSAPISPPRSAVSRRRVGRTASIR